MTDDSSKSGKSSEVDEASTTNDNAVAENKRTNPEKEIGGRDGPDPTRYGDWEKDGRCVDF